MSHSDPIFFHPDYTVGFGILSFQKQAPNHVAVRKETATRGLYRRWGITPRPEDFQLKSLYIFHKQM